MAIIELGEEDLHLLFHSVIMTIKIEKLVQLQKHDVCSRENSL